VFGDGFVALGSGKYGASGNGEKATKRIAPTAYQARIIHGIEVLEE